MNSACITTEKRLPGTFFYDREIRTIQAGDRWDSAKNAGRMLILITVLKVRIFNRSTFLQCLILNAIGRFSNAKQGLHFFGYR